MSGHGFGDRLWPRTPHEVNPNDKRSRRERRKEAAEQRRTLKRGRKLVKRVDDVRDVLKQLRAGQGVSLEDLHTEACFLVGLGHTAATILQGSTPSKEQTK